MLTIYGVYRSRASRNYWLAGELGIPFKSVPVIQAYRLSDPNAADAPLHTRTTEFLKINPNGHIPSMDDDGVRLHESLAINLYLAKKHGGPLAPANLAEDGLMTMWSLWAANEMETHALQVLTHRAGKPELRDPKLAQAAIDTLRAPFAVLDKALADFRLPGGRPLHGCRHQRRRGRALCDGRARAVLGRPAGESLARGLPRAPGVQGDDGQARAGAGVGNRAVARMRSAAIKRREAGCSEAQSGICA